MMAKHQNVPCNLLFSGSSKLEINASVWVTEDDGTLVEDDDVLHAFSGQVLMLLETGESWTIIGDPCDLIATSASSGEIF